MKELSIEEKAKAYDEAVEKAREWYNNPNSSSIGKSYLYAVFPELAESEDERIRNSLIEFLNQFYSLGIHGNYDCWEKADCSEWIAWLEKQGDQKPAWSEHDETCLIEALGCIKVAVKHAKNQSELCDCGMVEDWIKSIKDRVYPQPKQEWSEEDESLRRRCIGAIDMANLSDYTKDNLLNWLKSLRPQKRWEPSDLQIEALESATANCAYREYQDCLRELIGQLKKLKKG